MIMGLRWEETSGVDHPANLEEGWAVIKSRSGKISLEAPPLLNMVTVQKVKEKQYTFGVVYKATESRADPELDAHGEFIIADDLQEAQWAYVQTGDRRVYLQHGAQGIIPIGEYVDIVTWPYEVELELTLPGQTKKTRTMIPAGSVFMGVLWNDTGWPLIKDGMIRGFSLGGFRRKQKTDVKKGYEDMTSVSDGGFESLLRRLERNMSRNQFRAFTRALETLVTGDFEESGMPVIAKSRAVTQGRLFKLLDDCRELGLSDEDLTIIVRQFTGAADTDNDDAVRKGRETEGLGEALVRMIRASSRANMPFGGVTIRGNDLLAPLSEGQKAMREALKDD